MKGAIGLITATSSQSGSPGSVVAGLKPVAAEFSGARGLKEGLVEEGSRGTVGKPGEGGARVSMAGFKTTSGNERRHTCLQFTGHGGRGRSDGQARQRVLQAGGDDGGCRRGGHC